MDSDSFIVYIKTEDFYKDIANDVGKQFDISNYDKNNKRPLPIGKKKKIISLVKDELGEKIMIEFVGPGAKICSYLMYDNSAKKKAKGTKTCVIKQ